MAVSCNFLTVVFMLSFSAALLKQSGALTAEDVAAAEADDTSRASRHLLLSVLINLNKFLRPGSAEVEDDIAGLIEGQRQEIFPKTDLESLLDAKITAAKRARSDLSGVLPPWNEFCRMMHITSCVHSRQR